VAVRVLVLAVLAALGLASAASAASWTTFGFDPERTSFDPLETSLGPGEVGGLHQLWSTDLGGVISDQASYVNGLVLVGTEQGDEYALDAATGNVVWKRFLFRRTTTCHDTPGGRYGVSAPAVVDPATNRVYVAAADGKLHALDLATGKEAPGYPVAIVAHPRSEHVYGALNLYRGRIYAGYASYCDNAFYRGAIVAIDVAKAKRVARIFLTKPHTHGGGVWAWGGVSIDTAAGHLYAATGDAQSHREDADLAEHLLRLSPDLKLEGATLPPVKHARDADFGAHPILFRGAGCPPQLALMHKTGTLLLYDRNRIDRGPRQRLQLADPRYLDAFGTYAWSPPDRTLFVSLPSRPPPAKGGLLALRLGSDCLLKRRWRARTGADHDLRGVPVVADGVIWTSAGQRLYALDASDGRRLWDSGTTFSQVVVAAPTLGDGRVFASSWDGHVRAFAP